MQTKTGSGCGKHVILGFNPTEFGDIEEIRTATLWSWKR